MKLNVALLPRLLSDPRFHICAVIDVLRATSSIVTLVANDNNVELAATTALARRIAAESEHRYVLCGEVGGLRPRGFDYGNSPSEFATLDTFDDPVLLATTNGTRAMRSVATAPAVFVAALLNATAATRALLLEAKTRGLDAALVCSGLEQGRTFSLEDTFTAGAMVDQAVKLASEHGIDLDPADSAVAALRLYRSYRGDALAAFRQAQHGQSLIAIGLERDLAFCAQADRYDIVPRLFDNDRASQTLRLSADRQA